METFPCCFDSGVSADSASWDSNWHNGQPHHRVHCSYWGCLLGVLGTLVFIGVVLGFPDTESNCQTATEGVERHSVADTGDAAGSGCGSTEQMVHRWSLVTLLETLVGAGASVASRDLFLKPHLLSFYLLVQVVHHYSSIHQCLEIRVCVGYELKS